MFAFIRKLFRPNSPPKPQAVISTGPERYRYVYKRHPFDDAKYFWIEAGSVAEADQLAVDHYTHLFETGHTIMDGFHRMKKADDHE